MKQILFNKFSLASLVFFLLIGCATDSKQEQIARAKAGTNPTTSAAGVNVDKSITLPANFSAQTVIEKTGRARQIAVNVNGDIYIQLSKPKSGKGMVALRDTDGDAAADEVEYFGDHSGTGMGIYDGHLYSSSPTEVFRYPLDGTSLVPNEDNKILIAGGFPKQQQHDAKSITFDSEGHLYVNVGAPSNACMIEARTKGSPGADPCPQLEWQGGIWQFDAKRPAQTQKKDGVRYATGIRNGMALDWNFATNSLYVVQHGRDQLNAFFPELFNEKESAEFPSEEFFKISKGDDCGWPYCYYDWQENKKLLNPEYGGDRKKTGRCANKKQPILGFPGHLAPNDLLFYTGDQFPERYKNGAFIAFHGSWNRTPEPQKGYFVVFVPFKDGQPYGDWEIFAEGFAGTEVVKSSKDAKHRPMGLAIGPDGSLYVADSTKGKIWKVSYTG